MSRWSKRSLEEKADILRKLEALKTEVADKTREQSGVLKLVDDKASGDAMKCYEAGDLPMPCPTHGWTGSDQYSIVKHEPMPGMPTMDMVQGKCRKCGRTLRRAFPRSEEMLVFMAAIMALKTRGRLQDER